MGNDLIGALRRETAADLDRVAARVAAVDVLSDTVARLRQTGVKFVLDRDAGGLVRLSVDLDVAAEVEAAPEAAPVVAAPEVEPVAVRAPEPQPQPEPDPEGPVLVTGPVSDEERDLIVAMSVDGMGAKEIADRLDRPVGTINVMRRHLKARIDAAAGEATAAPDAAQPSPLSAAERAIDAHLESIGYPQDWSAASDLALCEALARGDGAMGAADELGRGKPEVIARWKAINLHPGNIDHQARLARVLRHRAGRGA